MFRANIYSLEPLGKEARNEIHNGLEMVATYMGETALSKELLVRAPTNSRGQVDPSRASFDRLDKLVELHVMALPLVDSTHKNRLGIAGVGSGWAYVDPEAATSALSLRSASAHEVGHALGFVVSGSDQHDPSSDGHCADPTCIMHARQELKSVYVPDISIRRGGTIRSAARRILGHPPVELGHFELRDNDQYDFCIPCKLDLRHLGQHNLKQLRVDRLAPGARIKHS